MLRKFHLTSITRAVSYVIAKTTQRAPSRAISTAVQYPRADALQKLSQNETQASEEPKAFAEKVHEHTTQLARLIDQQDKEPATVILPRTQIHLHIAHMARNAGLFTKPSLNPLHHDLVTTNLHTARRIYDFCPPDHTGQTAISFAGQHASLSYFIPALMLDADARGLPTLTYDVSVLKEDVCAKQVLPSWTTTAYQRALIQGILSREGAKHFHVTLALSHPLSAAPQNISPEHKHLHIVQGDPHFTFTHLKWVTSSPTFLSKVQTHKIQTRAWIQMLERMLINNPILKGNKWIYNVYLKLHDADCTASWIGGNRRELALSVLRHLILINLFWESANTDGYTNIRQEALSQYTHYAGIVLRIYTMENADPAGFVSVANQLLVKHGMFGSADDARTYTRQIAQHARGSSVTQIDEDINTSGECWRAYQTSA